MTNVQFTKVGDDVIPTFDHKRPLVLRLVFEQEVNHNSCVFNMWLDMTRNLQRLDFTGLPFNIVVQLETPTYRSQEGGEATTQMGRLFDAARETHMDYLDAWFPQKEEKGIREAADDIPECCRTDACVITLSMATIKEMMANKVGRVDQE